MAGTATPIFPQTLMTYGVQILPADTTTQKVVVTGGANGTKIEMLNISSTDTAARDVQLFLHNGTTAFLLGTLPVVANAGNTNAILATGLLASLVGTSPYLPFLQFPLDVNGNRYLYIASTWSLRAAVLTTVTAAKIINIVAIGGEF